MEYCCLRKQAGRAWSVVDGYRLNSNTFPTTRGLYHKLEDDTFNCALLELYQFRAKSWRHLRFRMSKSGIENQS